MEAKHTPGPWEAVVNLVRSEYGTNEDGIGGGGLLVADCSSIGMPGTANARLIAAAPELLGACERAVSDLEGKIYLAYLEAAIAKAKGEA